MFDPNNPFVCLYEGYVTDNVDPSVLGRVKICVPGLIEPESDWALPLGMPGAGADARGLWCVPAVGANVTVFFREGDPEHIRYFPGPWAAPEGAEVETPNFVRDLTPAEATQVAGLQTDMWNLVLDDRGDGGKLVLQSRAKPENAITLNAVTGVLEVSGAFAVSIRSTGVVKIDALHVVINGRPVLPTKKPI